MAEVSFDVDDYLYDASTKELRREVDRRIERGDWIVSKKEDGVEPWTKEGLAEDLRTAFYVRNANRFEDLLRVLEPRRVTVGLAS